MIAKLTIRHWTALLLGCVVFVVGLPGSAFAQTVTLGGIPTVIEVYFQSSKMVPAPGLSDVIVLDEEVCSVELNNGQLKVFGLSRGETVLIGQENGVRKSVIVRVTNRPIVIAPPTLRRETAELLGQGTFTSNLDVSNSESGSRFSFTHGVYWGQRIGDMRLGIRTDVEEPFTTGVPNFNVRTASIQFATPDKSLTLLDFTANLGATPSGGSVTHVSTANYIQLRGLDLTLKRGRNDFEIFGGTSLPSYFLSLSGTRNVFGFTVHRQQTEKLQLYASSSAVNFLSSSTSPVTRETSFPQTLGFDYRLNQHWNFVGRGGLSEDGGSMLGEAAYAGNRLTGSISAQTASQNFGLNQVQVAFTPGSSINVTSSYKVNSRLTQSASFQHTVVESSLLFATPTTSDYFSANTSWKVKPQHQFNFNYTLNRIDNQSSPSSNSTNSRYDFALNSSFNDRFSNSAQVTVGHIDDPFQLNSQSQLSLRDGVSVRIPNGNLLVNFEHNVIDPALVARLNQRLGLLSPQLQTLFKSDPITFVNSPNLPQQIRDLLSADQPNSDSLSATAQLRIGQKLNLSPTISFSRAAQSSSNTNFNHQFGYTASYQSTSTLQLRSSLTNLFLWDSATQGLRRSTFFTLGISKSFIGSPKMLLPARNQRLVQGRVFRDSNINGTYNDGEPGFANIAVELSDGQRAITDSEGRFHFKGLGQNAYTVRLSLAQFKDAVRVTTPIEVPIDLIESTKLEVDFGVVNFARVIGNVYNDYLMRGQRELDADGIRDVRLVLDGATRLITKSSGNGEFEFENVPPGDYRLSLEPDSLPPNYAGVGEFTPVHVDPVSTLIADVPVRAFRSISGRILLKLKQTDAAAHGLVGQDGNGNGRNGNGRIRITEQPKPENGNGSNSFVFVPLVGVQLTADHANAVSDTDGNFLLRNLPAGEFILSVVPNRPLPANLNAPSGKVKLTREPQQIQGATIVISSPELAKYLVPEAAKQE